VVAQPRFLSLSDVAEVLNITAAQTYALVRSGELPAIKVGKRGHWRVEREALESYIAEAYSRTRTYVQSHPLGGSGDLAGELAADLEGDDVGALSRDAPPR
jgi:excisionase family DNA binding protein